MEDEFIYRALCGLLITTPKHKDDKSKHTVSVYLLPVNVYKGEEATSVVIDIVNKTIQAIGSSGEILAEIPVFKD